MRTAAPSAAARQPRRPAARARPPGRDSSSTAGTRSAATASRMAWASRVSERIADMGFSGGCGCRTVARRRYSLPNSQEPEHEPLPLRRTRRLGHRRRRRPRPRPRAGAGAARRQGGGQRPGRHASTASAATMPRPTRWWPRSAPPAVRGRAQPRQHRQCRRRAPPGRRARSTTTAVSTCSSTTPASCATSRWPRWSRPTSSRWSPCTCSARRTARRRC